MELGKTAEFFVNDPRETAMLRRGITVFRVLEIVQCLVNGRSGNLLAAEDPVVEFQGEVEETCVISMSCKAGGQEECTRWRFSRRGNWWCENEKIHGRYTRYLGPGVYRKRGGSVFSVIRWVPVT